MNGSGNLTLEEIGRRAGVSRSTVSRVLNAEPGVRAEVRERVESVIAETGYLPNQAARALVSSRSGLIGLLVLTEADELFGDPYYSALVTGIQQGCLDHGVVFTIFPVLGDGGPDDVLVRRIAHGFVDGVIATAGPGPRDQLITTLRDRGTPMVVIGHPADERGLLRVDVENRAGGVAAVEHLADHGRRRIGFVGPTSAYRFGDERLEGYRSAVAERGLDADDDLVALDEPTAEGGRRAAERLLAARPDAIHVATDTMAGGVYRALAAGSVGVPDDVAVIGFDGLPRGPVLDPLLTTIAQPVAEVGRTAVALLVGDDRTPRVVVLPTALRLGDSCGEHPATA